MTFYNWAVFTKTKTCFWTEIQNIFGVIWYFYCHFSIFFFFHYFYYYFTLTLHFVFCSLAEFLEKFALKGVPRVFLWMLSRYKLSLCVREEGESRLFICVPDFGMTNTDWCAAQRQTQVTALKKKKNKERWRLIGVINIIQERWALNWRWPEISNEMPAPKAAAHLT